MPVTFAVILITSVAYGLTGAPLARRLGLPRQKLRYHLGRLEAAGLIEPAGSRKARGCTERLLRRRSRRLLLHPYLLDDTAKRTARRIDPRSWTYLRSRAVRLIRELDSAANQALGAPLTLEAQVDFRDEDARARFEKELGDAFRTLADRFGGGALACRYLLVGWPEPAKRRSQSENERAH